MSQKVRAYFSSPALPAAGLLFGLVFCLAITFFLGFKWLPLATMVFYSVFFAWVATLAWYRRNLLRNFGTIDKLFWAFVLVILASFLLHDVTDAIALKYVRFIPFMVILPYICGRLMQLQDLRILVNILCWAGPLILILSIADYWLNLANIPIYSRWRFFGYDHTPLLIGFVLSGSMLALTFKFFTWRGDEGSQRGLRLSILLIAIGVTLAAIVLIAARGALLGGLLGIMCMAFTIRYLRFYRRFLFLIYVFSIIALVSFALPKSQAQLYARLLTSPDIISVAPSKLASGASLEGLSSASVPILGPESCKPFEIGTNSVAMRWVLYQEAFEIFKTWPWAGVGAALFGRNSCTGNAGFPHSTLLQSMAELGIVGAVLYCALIIAGVITVGWRAVCVADSQTKQAAQLTLALLAFYLFTDQIYGNYFMAVGSFFLIGVSAGIRSYPLSSKGI